MCWGTWKNSRCLSKEDGLPVGAAMMSACAASGSVDKLLKERFDLLEDCEKTRESGDSKDPRESRRIESALLILDVMDDIDSCETYKTSGGSDSSPARLALSVFRGMSELLHVSTYVLQALSFPALYHCRHPPTRLSQQEIGLTLHLLERHLRLVSV